MRILYIILCFITFVNAKSSFEIAKQLVNDDSKIEKLKLLFAKDSYMINNRADIKAINQILKMNSLLQYNFANAKNISLTFNTKANATLFFKIISIVFEQIGVNYYEISSFDRVDDNISISFNINSKYAIDIGLVYDELKNMNVFIDDIYRYGSNFIYNLDFNKAVLNADFILDNQDNKSLNLSKPLQDYFIRLVDVKQLIISASDYDIWYPKIEFLDENLNLIQAYSQENKTKSLTINVPYNCKFVNISDLFTLDNIKHGLNIEVN